MLGNDQVFRCSRDDIDIHVIKPVIQDVFDHMLLNDSLEYEGDINRVRTKYGTDYAIKVPKLTTGTALVQNPEYNEGKPWFVSFRPLLHDTFRLTEKELTSYSKFKKEVEDVENRLKKLKAKKVDTYDVELELNLAKEKMKSGMFRMAEDISY